MFVLFNMMLSASVIITKLPVLGMPTTNRKTVFSFSWTILLHLAILVFGIHS